MASTMVNQLRENIIPSRPSLLPGTDFLAQGKVNIVNKTERQRETSVSNVAVSSDVCLSGSHCPVLMKILRDCRNFATGLEL